LEAPLCKEEENGSPSDTQSTTKHNIHHVLSPRIELGSVKLAHIWEFMPRWLSRESNIVGSHFPVPGVHTPFMWCYVDSVYRDTFDGMKGVKHLVLSKCLKFWPVLLVLIENVPLEYQQVSMEMILSASPMLVGCSYLTK